MFNSLPAKTSYFSINTYIDRDTVAKISIAIDIIRQYMNLLKKKGQDVRIFSIEGYGSKVSLEEILYGAWMTFYNIYGYPTESYSDTEIYTGVYCWNRDVTNPTIDIAMALKIYDQISKGSCSYNDKFTRLETLKKLFMKEDYPTKRVYSNYLETGYIEFYYLRDLNSSFYTYIEDKIEELQALAENETISVSVPSKLKYKFDENANAKTYDSTYENQYYKNGLMNLNSVVIKANKFYATFLTAIEQILYRYTKQRFPLKIYASIASLFNSYIKLIVKYAKPLHAKMIESFPAIRFNESAEDSVNVGDVVENNMKMQIYTDVVSWNFDNPYDYEPENYDTRDKITDDLRDNFKMTITDLIEEHLKLNNRVDQDDIYIDGHMDVNQSTVPGKTFDTTRVTSYPSEEHSNSTTDTVLYEDITMTAYCKANDVKLSIGSDMTKFYLYPTDLYLNDNLRTVRDITNYITYSDNAITNVSDRDIVVITDNYNPYGSYAIKDVVFKRYSAITNSTTAKIGFMCDDNAHLYSKPNRKWIYNVAPNVSNMYRTKNQESSYSILFDRYNTASYFTTGTTDISFLNKYCNFIRFMIYLPVGETVTLPTVSFTYRIKL